jgi:hypothetical protein
LIFAKEDSPNVTYRSIVVCVERAATAFITCANVAAGACAGRCKARTRACSAAQRPQGGSEAGGSIGASGREPWGKHTGSRCSSAFSEVQAKQRWQSLRCPQGSECGAHRVANAESGSNRNESNPHELQPPGGSELGECRFSGFRVWLTASARRGRGAPTRTAPSTARLWGAGTCPGPDPHRPIHTVAAHTCAALKHNNVRAQHAALHPVLGAAGPGPTSRPTRRTCRTAQTHRQYSSRRAIAA